MNRRTARIVTSAALAATALCIARPAAADTNYFAETPGRFGLGLGATNFVSGLTGKLFLSPAVALQATIGGWYGGYACDYYGCVESVGFAVDVDAIFEMPRIWQSPDFAINWNLGLGGAFVASGYPLYGFEFVAGLGIQCKLVPLELVLELRPAFLFDEYGYVAAPYWGGGGIALRYFFGGK